MNSSVLATLTGKTTSKAKLINEDNLKSDKPSNFTATIKDINEVYSLFPGQVIYIGYYEGMGSITVLVADKEIVRYLNLSEIDVVTGNVIKEGKYLGLANKQHGLQFEYACEWQGTSYMPIRVNMDQNVITYFKQNPISLLEGKYVPEYRVSPTDGHVNADTIVELTEDQFYEFNNYIVRAPKVNSETNEQPSSAATMTESMIKEMTNGKGIE